MSSHTAVAAFNKVVENGRFGRSEEGQDLLEYGLLAALIALVAAGAVTTVGNTIQAVFRTTIATNF